MSPRSGWYLQNCKCGTAQHAKVSITLASSTLGTNPRRKSRAMTIYICDDCLKKPKPKTRAGIVAAVLTVANAVTVKERKTK